MSVIIQNISGCTEGINKYRLRINDKVICEFEHDRKYNALAQCLRDAADAVDSATEARKQELDELVRMLMMKAFINKR